MVGMEVGEKVQMVGEATLFLSHPTSREARQLAGTSEESMLVLGVVVLPCWISHFSCRDWKDCY